MKKLLKIILLVLVSILLLLAGFLAYMSITDWKPEEVTEQEVENNQEGQLKQGVPFTTTTFNIGYGGLDKDQDFFMDGGVGSRSSSKEQTVKNIEAFQQFLTEIDSDVVLLQEVDLKASRSFHLNQYDVFKKTLPSYGNSFALNYDVQWVPVPVLNPMGSVKGGLATFSKYKIEAATRYDLPGKENWPVQMFELDRCLLETVIPVDNGKKLRMVNLHLSAYDEGGKIRKVQIQYVKEYLKKHSENEDYIILGGDWNQLLSNIQKEDPTFQEQWPEWLVELPKDFTEGGFQWGVDDHVWTVRDNVKSYVPGENFVTIIDGFLVSPNVKILDVKGHDLGFEHSDHNPVSATLQLN